MAILIIWAVFFAPAIYFWIQYQKHLEPKWLGGIAACMVLAIAAWGPFAPRPSSGCHTEWDGRSNSAVCD